MCEVLKKPVDVLELEDGVSNAEMFDGLFEQKIVNSPNPVNVLLRPRIPQNRIPCEVPSLCSSVSVSSD